VATPEVQRLERLIEVGRALVTELDLDTLLDRILDAARDLTGARFAALGVLDERRQELERFVTVGVDAATHEAIGDLPRGRGVLGTLISDPKPLRLEHVGEHPDSFGFPPGHPRMDSFLGVPVTIRGEAWGNLYLTEKEGGPFDADDEAAVVILADWAGIAVDNARLYQRERGRRRELERAVRGFETTAEIARALGGETEMDRVLELIVKRGRALVEARSMLIALPDGDEIVVQTAAGQIDRGVVGTRTPREGSVTGEVLETRRPVNARGGLYVPLLYRNRALGVLAAFDRVEDGPEFHAEDERLMEAFAAAAASAVATAQNVAAEGVRRALAASEQERRRWARELHDETLQDLAALRMLLATARRGGDPEQLGAAVDDAVEALGRGIDGLRGLIADVRPAALDQLGLGDALASLARRVAERTGLEVDFRCDLGDRLEPELESTLYRLVQEALNNVVKHAAASRVDVAVGRRDGEVHVTVRDDGRGFEPAERRNGFGLMGMEERVELAGGRLEVTSRPGEGTEVAIAVPAGR
jgi:signal transduction histidine kinase